MTMRGAVADMIAQADDMNIGLVMRWDNDNRMVWTMWSVRAGQRPTRETTPVYIRPFVKTRRDPVHGGGHVDHALGLTFDLGLHAEEVMMLSWENLLNTERQLKGPAYSPRIVDIVLSKSPCHGAVGSQPLRIQFSDGALDMSVTGCASKLRMFFTSRWTAEVRKWNVWYFELAGAQAAVTDQMKLDAGVRAVGIRERVEQDIATRLPQIQAKYARAPAHVASGLVNRDVTNLRRQRHQALNLVQAENDMRVTSVGLAQYGITLLQQLAHVDVQRILRTAIAGTLPEHPSPFT